MSDRQNMIIGSIPKLPIKHALWIMPLILSGVMSGLVSLISMLKNVGWVDHFWSMWFGAWMLSWGIAFPAVLLVMPIARRLTAIFVNMKPPQSS